MSAKKEELGKGIRALLGGIDNDMSSNQTNIDKKVVTPDATTNTSILLSQIEINPFQPRAEFDEESLNELAESIAAHGVIQPLTVRSLGGNKFQLIAGERRLRASKMAGLDKVPVFIRKANDQEMLEIGLIENIQREDLNAMEISINYKRLMDECNLTQEEMAARLGKNRSTVTNYLRLLKLPPEIQSGIKNKSISMGHARAIIALPTPEAQLMVFKDIIKKGLSVRQVEALAKDLQKPGNGVATKPAPKEAPIAYRRVQDRLATLLATKVQVKHKKDGKGEISIAYYSDDDLDRILDILNA